MSRGSRAGCSRTLFPAMLGTPALVTISGQVRRIPSVKVCVRAARTTDVRMHESKARPLIPQAYQERKQESFASPVVSSWPGVTSLLIILGTKTRSKKNSSGLPCRDGWGIRDSKKKKKKKKKKKGRAVGPDVERGRLAPDSEDPSPRGAQNVDLESLSYRGWFEHHSMPSFPQSVVV